MQKTVYQLDNDGYYVGATVADTSPMILGANGKPTLWDGNPQTAVWLIPAGCVVAAPPTFQEGQAAHWTGTAWEVVDLPSSPAPEPEVPPTPTTLSRWQFFAVAAQVGIISEQDAEAALDGTLPQPFVDFIATLPADEQFKARMLLKGTQVFRRNDPNGYVEKFAASRTPPMTDAQIDAIFTQGALL